MAALYEGAVLATLVRVRGAQLQGAGGGDARARLPAGHVHAVAGLASKAYPTWLDEGPFEAPRLRGRGAPPAMCAESHQVQRLAIGTAARRRCTDSPTTRARISMKLP